MEKHHLHHLSYIDLDGFGCQKISNDFKDEETTEVSYYNSDYGSEILDNLEMIVRDIEEKMGNEETRSHSHTVLITDLNLSEDQAKFIETKSEELGFELVLLTHDESGYEVSKGRDWYHIIEGKSSTLLTFEYFQFEYAQEKIEADSGEETRLPYEAKVINAYDLYEEDSREFRYGKNVSYILSIIARHFPRKYQPYREIHDTLCRYFIQELGLFLTYEVYSQVRILEIATEKLCHELWKYSEVDFEYMDFVDRIEYLTAYAIVTPLKTNKYKHVDPISTFVMNVNGVTVNTLVACPPVHVSSGTMNLILKTFSEYQAIAICKKDGSVSLRSLGALDVGKFAEVHGGSGNKNAAECTLENVMEKYHSMDLQDRTLSRLLELIDNDTHFFDTLPFGVPSKSEN